MAQTLISKISLAITLIVLIAIGTFFLSIQLGAGIYLGVAVLIVLAMLGVALLHSWVVGPLQKLGTQLEAATRSGQELPIEATRDDELGQIQRSAGQLVGQLLKERAEHDERYKQLSGERDRLQSSLKELQSAVQERETLATTVEQLSTPILPVLNGVLVAPIVGVVDERRADYLQLTLLEAIQSQRARVMILDLTGLISVDPLVIRTILQSAQSAKLLGAQPIIVGITPEVAEVLVQLGLQLNEIMIMADLQAAVSFARSFIYRSKGPVVK